MPKTYGLNQCRTCPDSKFTSNEEYLIHLDNQHNGAEVYVYMCSKCGKQFKRKSELSHHNNSNCGTVKLYCCKICNINLMNPGSLHNHILTHKKKPTFMCKFCALLFLTSGQLKIHERKHTKEKVFSCNICFKKFSHRQSLITHMSIHTGVKPYQCEHCGKSFSCIGNLLKHRKTHRDTCGLTMLTSHRMVNSSTKIKVHINTPANFKVKSVEKKELFQKKIEDIRKNFTDTVVNKKAISILDVKTETNICDKTNGSLNTIMSQMGEQSLINVKKEIKNEIKLDAINNSVPQKIVQQERILPKTCSYCPKTYKQMAQLHKHQQQHLNLENCFECVNCKIKFETQSQRDIHEGDIHTIKLSCQDCKKVFSNPNSLKVHLNIHRGIPRKRYSYICDCCGLSFSTKLMLDHHKFNKCKKGIDYVCDYCRKSFTRKSTLTSHMRIHTLEKQFNCNFCNKSFHWASQLIVHLRSHTNEKPFKCTECSKSFAYRESLLTHSTIHSNIKPYSCEACRKRFSCVTNFLKHKNVYARTCGAWYEKNIKNHL